MSEKKTLNIYSGCILCCPGYCLVAYVLEYWSVYGWTWEVSDNSFSTTQSADTLDFVVDFYAPLNWCAKHNSLFKKLINKYILLFVGDGWFPFLLDETEEYDPQKHGPPGLTNAKPGETKTPIADE